MSKAQTHQPPLTASTAEYKLWILRHHKGTESQSAAKAVMAQVSENTRAIKVRMTEDEEEKKLLATFSSPLEPFYFK